MRDADLLDMSISDLRKLCAALQLPSSGKKNDVLCTLRQHYRQLEAPAPSVDGCLVFDAPTPVSSSAEESDSKDDSTEPPSQGSSGASQMSPSPPCTPPEPPTTSATPAQRTRLSNSFQQVYLETILEDGMGGLDILDPEMYVELSSMLRAQLALVTAPPEALLTPLSRPAASPTTTMKMPAVTMASDLEGRPAEPPIKKPMQPLGAAEPSPPSGTTATRRSSCRLNVAQPEPKKQSKRSLTLATQAAQKTLSADLSKPLAANVKLKRGRPRKEPPTTSEKRARLITSIALPPVALPPAPALGTLTPAWRAFFRKMPLFK